MPVEIKMKTNTTGNNDQFFLKMLPLGAQQVYKSVCAKGVKFNLAFYSVTADLSCVGKPNVSVTLPTSTTSLLKGTADHAVTTASSLQLIALLGSIKKALALAGCISDEVVLGAPTVCSLSTATGFFKNETPFFQDDLDESEFPKVGPLDNGMPKPEALNPQSVPKSEIPATPKGGGVVRLAQATQVGQPVRGSAGDSVYYAMALSPTLKLGVRVKKTGTVSIRAEGTPSQQEIKKLQDAGMSKAGSEHWSIHFDIHQVPASRCIGAFLMGLEISFDTQIVNFGQVKVEA